MYIYCVLICIWECQSWWELLEVSYVLLEVINLEPSDLVLSPLLFCSLSFSKYEIYSLILQLITDKLIKLQYFLE